MVAFVWGLFLLACGLGLFGWIGYGLFVERQETAQGRNPLPATVFAGALVVVGALRIWSAGRGRSRR